MDTKTDIVRLVEAAKTNTLAADELISAYLPFIKAQTEKFLKRPPQEGRDDELSIAMIAFHEAICGYSRMRGAFLKYAAMLIRSRLIDYHRQEKRHESLVSLDTPSEKDDTPIGELITDGRDHSEELAVREATRAEIEELGRNMQEFGVSLSDVADNCPKQKRTLNACQRAVRYAKEHPELLEDFLRTKRLPITKLAVGSGVEKKTLERHRSYMAALLLIYTNGYEIIRGHLAQVMREVTS